MTAQLTSCALGGTYACYCTHDAEMLHNITAIAAINFAQTLQLLQHRLLQDVSNTGTGTTKLWRCFTSPLPVAAVNVKHQSCCVDIIIYQS